jgi:hypothetical protein
MAQPNDAPSVEQTASVDEFEARGATVAAALNGGVPLYSVSLEA